MLHQQNVLEGFKKRVATRVAQVKVTVIMMLITEKIHKKFKSKHQNPKVETTKQLVFLENRSWHVTVK